MKKRLINTLIVAVTLLLVGCQQEEPQPVKQPRDIVIDIPDPCKTGVIEAYENGELDFGYEGTIDIVNDGKDGEPIRIVVDVDEVICMGYIKPECDDIQNMSTASKMIRAQGEQIGSRPTFRDVVDRIMQGIQNGDFVMSDPVPEGFLQSGHIGVAEYIADKYDIRGDADGHDKGTAEYIPEQKG